MTQKKIKRRFDVVFALFCSIFAIPILGISMLVVKICSPEDPVLFKQTRIGFQGKPFTIYKLRTMTNEKDADGNLLPDEERIKNWGKFLRKFSIDELTQIYHILKGEMSWIGPRPLKPEEMMVMTKKQQELRQSMRPGITGWEAVNEGKTNSRKEMARYDLYYVQNWSILFDFRIFVRTVWILATGDRAIDELRAPKLRKEELV